MDAISYSLADKQAKRIKKIINEPDSTSGVVTVPKVIPAGETITIPAGRTAVLPNVQVDGTLTVDGDLFVPSGATAGDLENQIGLKADTTYVNNKPSGFKNYIINGGFDVWQRGTSFSGHSKYYADRWVEYTDTDDGYTVTKVNLNASDITQTGQNKALKVSVTAGTTGSLNDLRQKIEFPEQFNGKTLTLSFWYKSSIPVTVNNIRVDSYINGVDLIHLNPQSINSTTTWQRAQFTFTCSGMDVTTLTANDYLDVIISSPVGVTVDYYITGVQLEEGSVATPFEQRPYGLELSLCQRYYEKSSSSVSLKRVINYSTSNSTLQLSSDFKVTKRVNPTMVVYGDINDGVEFNNWDVGLIATKDSFTAYKTNIPSGSYMDLHYYIADAEL